MALWALAGTWSLSVSAEVPEWTAFESGREDAFYFRLEVDPTLTMGDGAIQVFNCTVFCRTSPELGSLRLRVFDQANNKLHEGLIPMEMGPGKTRAKFQWDTAGLGYEMYRLRFDILFEDERIQSPWNDITAYKQSEGHTSAMLEQFASDTAALERHFEALEINDSDLAYTRMRLALSNHTIKLARQALDSGNWRAATRYVAYGSGLINRVRTQITFFANEPELYHAPRRPDLKSLTAGNHGFRAEGQQVYLFGLAGDDRLAADMDMLAALGLNQATFYVDPAQDDFAPTLSSDLAEAAGANVSVTVQVTPPGLAPNSPDLPRSSVAIPESLPIGSQGKPYRDRLVSLTALLAEEPIVNGLSIMQRPTFDFQGESIRRSFIEYLRVNYEDRDQLNRAWKSRHREYSDIQIAVDRPRPAFVYDWTDFHLNVVDTYLRGYTDSLRAKGGPVRLQITLDDGAIHADNAANHVDPESLGGMVDVIGVATPTPSADGRFLLDHPRSSMMFTLADAFSEGAPVVGSAMSIVPENAGSAPGTPYARSLIWEAVMAGADGASAWAWDETDPSAIFHHPAFLEGLCAAAIDINRLGNIVHAFQTAHAPIAVLWSRSSRIFQSGDPFVESVSAAYEGASFGGQRVRMVSERECAEGALSEISVLVIPRATSVRDDAFDAINAYIDGGGTVVRTGTPIPYTARGHSRADVISSTVNTLLVRGVEDAGGYLHGIESAYSRDALPQTPRAVNEHGYLLEGVRSRCVEVDGKSYLYLLNMRDESVLCHLAGNSQQGRDLIEGINLRFPLDLPPLRPMVIALESGEADVRMATVGGAPADSE